MDGWLWGWMSVFWRVEGKKRELKRRGSRILPEAFGGSRGRFTFTVSQLSLAWKREVRSTQGKIEDKELISHGIPLPQNLSRVKNPIISTSNKKCNSLYSH